MFDIRLRKMSDDGTTRGAVLQTVSIDATHVDSATPTLSFTVSEKVAGRLDAPQVVALEFSTGSGYMQPRNGLFIAEEDDADDADPAGTVKFTASGYVPWLMARTYLHWAPDANNWTRTITEAGGVPASPGHVIASVLLYEARLRGWGPSVTWDFTGTHDSAGLPWAPEDRSTLALRLLTPASNILSTITEQGLCDWWTEGTRIRLFRPGTGWNREDLVFGGPGFSARPVKSSFKDVFTHLTIVPEESPDWLYLTNDGATDRFGRLEATMTQSGISDHGEATRLAQPTLTGGRAVKREYSFDWTPSAGGPRPFADVNTGDIVTSKTRHGRNPQRVIGIQVRKQSDAVTARIIVGDKLLSQSARLLRRTVAATIGGTIGGSGSALPVSNGPTLPLPAVPTALHVESNLGSWRADGTAQAEVTLEWEPVTMALDGSQVDIREYELAERTLSGESATFATTSGLEHTVTTWETGIARYVKVRARAFNGNVSDWSPEIAVIPATPTSIVPKAPTDVTVVSNVGAFRNDGSASATVTVEWEPVTQSIDDELIDIAEYEVRTGLTAWRVTGSVATFTISAGQTVEVVVRALTTIGTWGDSSTTLPVTGASPAVATGAPTAPVLETRLGIVAARWDGMLTTGAPAPGFGFVYMDTAPDELGPWEPVGTPLTGAGGANIKGVPGSTVWVRLRATDTLGRPTGTSAAASIVVVGAIGDDIEAGSISVNHVEPSFGDDLNISANNAVTIVVGRQDAQANELANLHSDVGDAQSTAEAASSAAGTAQAAAEGATEAAGQAQAAADDVANRLAVHQTYYRFGVDYLGIGDPASAAELRLSPEGVQITQNNVIVSQWIGGVFIAPEARLEQASIGNHQFLAYGPGRTIVRPLD